MGSLTEINKQHRDEFQKERPSGQGMVSDRFWCGKIFTDDHRLDRIRRRQVKTPASIFRGSWPVTQTPPPCATASKPAFRRTSTLKLAVRTHNPCESQDLVFAAMILILETAAGRCLGLRPTDPSYICTKTEKPAAWMSQRPRVFRVLSENATENRRRCWEQMKFCTRSDEVHECSAGTGANHT